MNFTIENLAIYCAQVAIVIAAGALVPLAFGLRAPKPLLAYWHLLLVSCVALPFLQPWKSQAVIVLHVLPLHTRAAPLPAAGVITGSFWSAPELVALTLALGAALRFLWLCAGFLKLRFYRRAASPLQPLPSEIRALRSRLAPHADLLISDRLTSPVTFGLWSPAILLPSKFLDFSTETREAIVCHELLHIQRRDWLIAIGEELVRCALWFHPAVWWLLGRIQLAREQVVDLAVIERTCQPDLYVDALLVIAQSKLQADLAPAPLFLKKRHLRQRVTAIVQGVPVNQRLLVVSAFAAFSVLPVVIGVTAWQFPLIAAPQQVLDGPGVELKDGPWTILHRAGIAHPREAGGNYISGDVVVAVNLNAKGEVIDARVVSGPDELRKAVLESVLHWHFATSDGDLGNGVRRPSPPSFELAIRFNALRLPPPPPPPPPLTTVNGQQGGTLASVDVSSLPREMQARVLAALPTPGATFGVNDLDTSRLKLLEIDSHMILSISMGSDRNVKLFVLLPQLSPRQTLNPVAGIHYGTNDGAMRPVLGAVPTEAPQSAGMPAIVRIPSRIRVGGDVQAANLIQKVTPAYPAVAKQARIQGTVRLEAIISPEGRISNLQLITGHPLLIESAIDAVSQWVYKPTLLNGNPVEVLTQIDVNYTLSDAPPAPPQ